jgi:MOSC domain-containing protein YiiM
MEVISVNVGLPRQVPQGRKMVTTAIFKEPVAGRVRLQQLNFDGDRQADLVSHGGVDKAVYLFPREHYSLWQPELTAKGYGWGAFGENLTISGILENDVNIGDVFQVGTTRLRVTQPRVPCYKLNLKFGRDDMVKRFGQRGDTGFYVAVEQEGEVGAGDTLTLLHRDEHNLTIAEVSSVFLRDRKNVDIMRRIVAHPLIADVWKEYYEGQIARLTDGQLNDDDEE